MVSENRPRRNRLNRRFDAPLFPVPGQQSWAEPDGETYVRTRDRTRLARQSNAVFELMKDGAWRTLAEISLLTGAPEASASARLRDLRKYKYGLHVVRRRRRTEGLFEYQLIVKGLRA